MCRCVLRFRSGTRQVVLGQILRKFLEAINGVGLTCQRQHEPLEQERATGQLFLLLQVLRRPLLYGSCGQLTVWLRLELEPRENALSLRLEAS